MDAIKELRGQIAESKTIDSLVNQVADVLRIGFEEIKLEGYSIDPKRVLEGKEGHYIAVDDFFDYDGPHNGDMEIADLLVEIGYAIKIPDYRDEDGKTEDQVSDDDKTSCEVRWFELTPDAKKMYEKLKSDGFYKPLPKTEENINMA